MRLSERQLAALEREIAARVRVCRDHDVPLFESMLLVIAELRSAGRFGHAPIRAVVIEMGVAPTEVE